jgi:hypothetical protein
LTAQTPTGRAGIKAQIESLNDGLLKDGPQTWHSALTGDAGQTSLIAAISRTARDSCGGLYGPQAAAQMQAQWEYLDAQQALTMAWYVNYLNDSGQSEFVMKTLRGYAGRRLEQTKLLRGVKDRDVEVLTEAGDTLVPTRTPLSCLPAGTTVQTDNRFVWWLDVGEMLPEEYQSDKVTLDIVQRTGLGALAGPRNVAYSNWQLSSKDEFAALVKLCGGSIGGDNDYFADAMRSRGFIFPPEGARIFSSREGSGFPVVFVDGAGWDGHPDSSTRASSLWRLAVGPDVTARYWYDHV